MALLRRAALLVLLAVPPVAVAAQQLEYQLKAAFLYNFVKFVEWPAEAFNGEKSPLSICVYGTDPFGDTLDNVVRGEAVGGRGLIVQRPESLDDLRDCHVLFVSRSEKARLAEILARVEGAPVLTVGDADGFLDAGGIINFVLEENKVRFAINPNAAERSRLKLSSERLRLAKPSP